MIKKRAATASVGEILVGLEEPFSGKFTSALSVTSNDRQYINWLTSRSQRVLMNGKAAHWRQPELSRVQ